jgi:trehalose 6-phosphate phosphatase
MSTIVHANRFYLVLQSNRALLSRSSQERYVLRNILSRSNRDVLEQFVWSNALFAFDYDGTLAPIVEEPGEARMRPETRTLLSALTRLAPVVIISGRARSDASDRLAGVPVLQVIGSHGVDPSHATDHCRAEVRSWLPTIERWIRPFQGVVVEDKTFSVAVHYRKSRAKREARAAILRAATSLPDARVIGGKQVVNVLPRDAPHKGIALLHERDRLRCDTAIYVGDDETDEDVFTLDQPGRLLTIRVGAKRKSAADFYVANQRAVDSLLRELVGLRRKRQHFVEMTR